MCVKTYPGPKGLRLTANSTTEAFFPTAPWMPALDLDGWQFNLMIRAVTNSFRARPGYQLAAVNPENATDPVGLGTATSTEGFTRFNPAIVDFQGQFFWRPGIMYSCVSGAIGQADVQLETQVYAHADLLGTRRIDLQPYNDADGTVAMFPVTDWFPTVQLEYVKAAIIVMNNLNNTMQNQMHIRWANDVDAPSTNWNTLEAGWNTPVSENSRRNTQKLGAGPSYNYAQLGLGVRKSSGSPNRATIHVASIAIRE